MVYFCISPISDYNYIVHLFWNIYMKNRPDILSNTFDQVPKTWEWYDRDLNAPDLHDQIIEAFDKDAKREQEKQRLMERESLPELWKKLLTKLDSIIEVMKEKWLADDIKIVEKTKERCIIYIKYMSNKIKYWEKKHPSYSERSVESIFRAEGNAYNPLVVVAWKRQDWVWITSSESGRYRRTNWPVGAAWIETIDVLFTEVWENVLLSQFDSTEKRWGGTECFSNDIPWIRLGIYHPGEHEKIILLSFDQQALEKLLR